MNKFVFLIAIWFCISFQSCLHEEESTAIETCPNIEIIAYDASETTAFSTTLKGATLNDIQIQECGFYLWTNEEEKFEERIVSTNIQEDGSFEVRLTNLQFATTYYFCTYAILDNNANQELAF